MVSLEKLKPLIAGVFNDLRGEYKERGGMIFGIVVERTDADVCIRYNGTELLIMCPQQQNPYGAVAKLIMQTAARSCYAIPLDFEHEMRKLQSRALVTASSSSSASSFSNPLNMSLEDGAAYILENSKASALQCLGLSNHATAQDIRDQYRNLALRYHPDKCTLQFASRVFQLLQAAYSALQKASPPQA